MSEFVYYNNTPDGSEQENCVTRAITLATGLPYKTITRLLRLTSEHQGLDCLTLQCYRYLLEYILGYPVKFPRRPMTVDEVIAKYPHNTLLIRIDGHLLTAVAGTIYDLFDSSKEYVTCYWIVQ